MANPVAVTYANLKPVIEDAGLPVSSGSAWEGVDAGSYQQFAAGAMYDAGVPYNHYAAEYGLAYPAVMPAAIAAEVGIDNYSASIAASPLSGTASLSVTATATETGATASNYNWNWGDGTTNSNTTVPTATHSYTVAGTYTVKMTPTVAGVIKSQVSAPAAVVVSAAG